MLAEKVRIANSGISDPAWNLSRAVYQATPINFFYVTSQDTSPQDLFFKPDGTKMYVLGSSSDRVNEYNLSIAWDVNTASYFQNFSIATQETGPTGLFFNSDGTKMYIVGTVGDDVNEYNLSTPWNVSTASYVQVFSFAAQEANAAGLFFKPDGTKMYILGNAGRKVYEYNLSTPWNVSTASYAQMFGVELQEASPTGLFFKPDGTKMYIIGSNGDDVNEYNLSTPWNVSTASYIQIFSVAAQDATPAGLFFNTEGTKMYILGNNSRCTYQYNLSTEWNVSTAVFTYPTTGYFYVVAQETSPQGLFFKPDGTKMYILGSSGDDVNEYNLSTPWNVSTASYVQVFGVVNQESTPQDIFFNPDGTKMYIIGSIGDSVNEYNLSTPWNVSTASYFQFFSVATQETVPTGLFFKPDGTKMYILGSTGDDVNEYNLSTPWNVSTASYVQVFSVFPQDATPQGIFFKPDGTKMYIIGSTNKSVNEYALSTPWDVSTARYIRLFSVANRESLPSSLFFKPDGTEMYIIGTDTDVVWSYNFV